MPQELRVTDLVVGIPCLDELDAGRVLVNEVQDRIQVPSLGLSSSFSLARLNEILALKLSEKQITTMLKKLDIQVTGDKTLRAKIPHYRRDLKLEEDLYEEVTIRYVLRRSINVDNQVPTARTMDRTHCKHIFSFSRNENVDRSF